MRACKLSARDDTDRTKPNLERLSVAYPIDERLRKSYSPKK